MANASRVKKESRLRAKAYPVTTEETKEDVKKPKQPTKKVKKLNKLGEFKLWVKGVRLVSNGVCDLLESSELMTLVGKGMEFIGKGTNEYNCFDEALKKDKTASYEVEVKICPNCSSEDVKPYIKDYDTNLRYCSHKCKNEHTGSEEDEWEDDHEA